MSDERRYYAVVQTEGDYRVESPNGYCVMETRDEGSAHHYADLMNKGFEAGYKAGYRAAKKAQRS